MTPESPVVLQCAGQRMVGIYHPGSAKNKTGVVIAVGGPQYRVGSHRQFVLMARAYADAGFSTLRFDYRGMGDAEGDLREFDTVDDDVRAAIDCIFREEPGLDQVVIIGLCDAASACLMYGTRDARVSGQVLLNPWVRSEQGEARSYLRHYYLQRVMQKAFWAKVFRGEANLIRSAGEFFASVLKARQTTADSRSDSPSGNFISRMLQGLGSFSGPIMFVISGRDLTAGEFTDLCTDDNEWRAAMKTRNVELVRIDSADHTLSKREHLDYVNSLVVNWLNIKHSSV